MYELLRTIHLIAVSPCLIIGAYLIYFSTKGSENHKILGWTYMVLMFFQSGISLFMEARVGPQLFNHFGWIHLLSVLTIYFEYQRVFIILKKGILMPIPDQWSFYIIWSGLIVAGGFTLVPGRYLYNVFFT
jgi:uncharacterized membrane protein